jgi:hypothetical protein
VTILEILTVEKQSFLQIGVQCHQFLHRIACTSAVNVLH